jgi:hypothetical protein
MRVLSNDKKLQVIRHMAGALALEAKPYEVFHVKNEFQV